MKRMLTTMNVDVEESMFGEHMYTIYCPKCKQKMRFASWERRKCKCGYEWKVKYLAVGEKEERKTQ